LAPGDLDTTDERARGPQVVTKHGDIGVPADRFTELADIAADQHGYVGLTDSRTVGYADNTIAQMARRGRIERVSRGVDRIPFLPGGRMGPYMAAVLWPVGVRGVISRDTGLDLWEVRDVNPTKIHLAVPRSHRPQREVPTATRYVAKTWAPVR
jgi:predicted transcriptional regulator of viral defense system